MPQQAAIAVADGKATPATHTFAAFGVGTASKQGEYVATWMNRSSSALTGGAESILSYCRPRKADGGYSLRTVLAIPITEVVGGVSAVTRTLKGTFSFDIPANATLAERTDLRALVVNTINHSQILTAVVNAEPIT